MKITYRIEQYDVDDFRIVITSPKYLEGIRTRIHAPYFLLSDLQRHINNNLKQAIRRFCIKHERYADILRNKTIELEPDKNDEYNSCWFFSGKFIDDTTKDISDEERESIAYENLVRYDPSYSDSDDWSLRIIVDPTWKAKRTGPIQIKSFEPYKTIDPARLAAGLGISIHEVYKFVQNQKKHAPNKGNSSYSGQTVFPRHIKDENGKIRFPIDEIRRYISALYKRKSRYKHLEAKYNSIVKHILDNTEHLKKTTWA